MKPFDPALASPFRVEWLVPMDASTKDDFERAVAEKAPAILRSARFMATQVAGDEAVDLEVRLWISAANGPGCVSITWEPGFHAYGFHLLDETLRERLAVIVFTDLPCVDADASLQQADDILRAALTAIRDAERRQTPAEMAERIREAQRSRRVPVVEGPVDTGVDP